MAVPRVQGVLTGVQPSQIASINKSDESGLYASARKVTLTQVDRSDRTKTLAATKDITLSPGQSFVTVKVTEMQDGKPVEVTKLAIVDSRALALARRAQANVDFSVDIVSEALSDKAIVDLHAVASLDAEVAISE